MKKIVVVLALAGAVVVIRTAFKWQHEYKTDLALAEARHDRDVL